MAWSLGYLPVQNPEQLGAFLLAAGKALYLANEYEVKCRHFLNLVRFAETLKAGVDADAALELCNAMKAKMLGGMMLEMRESSFVTLEEVDTLVRGKDARNFIAHESAAIGHLSSIRRQTLDRAIERLRKQIRALAEADNLVSGWLYVIEEKQSTPPTISKNYPVWIDMWVFGALLPEVAPANP